MDYEKLYKEALERARRNFSNEVVTGIFRELQESKDERIRKALVQNLKERFGTKGNMGEGLDMPDVLAWLEKQGESKPIGKLQLSEELYEHIRNTCACIDDALSSETLADINDYLSMAERSAKSAFDMIEKQGEQKPVDKVELKFKIGDWVVSPTGVYWHIDRIENNRYEVTSDTGKCADWPLDTNLYHLWTIQDAKDGDVLAYPDGSIVIFNHKCDDSICELFMAHVLYVDGHIETNNSCVIINATPATKEQRDTLFVKMKEAGYEWDFDKRFGRTDVVDCIPHKD